MLTKEDFKHQINNQPVEGKTPFYVFVEDPDGNPDMRIEIIFESDFKDYELTKNLSGIPWIKKITK